MRAYAVPGPGLGPVLLDVPEPEPGPDELLIEVLASSVNPVDAMMANGFFASLMDYRYPAVFGRDVCGTVVARGAHVTRFAVGDTVFGFIKREYVGDGTFAQLVTSPQDSCVTRAPLRVPPEDAGVLGQSAVTAQECLDELALPAGSCVLVNGATGGVGCFAVQLAAVAGLTVVATAGSADGARFVRRLGATHVVDRHSTDLAGAVRAAVPAGVDGLVDLVRRDTSTVIGMDETPAQRAFARFAMATVRPGGAVVSLHNAANPAFLDGLAWANVHSAPTSAALTRVADLADEGRLQIPVCARYPLSQIADAFVRQRSGVLGKVGVFPFDSHPPRRSGRQHRS